jgi:hypothetical protein
MGDYFAKFEWKSTQKCDRLENSTDLAGYSYALGKHYPVACRGTYSLDSLQLAAAQPTPTLFGRFRLKSRLPGKDHICGVAP